MKKAYEPSPDFVEKVMTRVHRLEYERRSVIEWLAGISPMRYILAGGGALCGIFTAVPVF